MAWVPEGWSPGGYVRDLLVSAYPLAYAFEGATDNDVAAYLSRPDGVAELQRWVADDLRAKVPDWMRGALRAAAEGCDPRAVNSAA